MFLVLLGDFVTCRFHRLLCFIAAGAAARLSCILVARDRKWGCGRKAFQIMLAQRGPAQRHARIRMFIASDKLVRLLELTVYVQRTKTLVLTITPGCYIQEVAVEIVTSHSHSVQVNSANLRCNHG